MPLPEAAESLPRGRRAILRRGTAAGIPARAQRVTTRPASRSSRDERKVLRCSGLKAMVLTTRAHVSGRAAVWVGSLEVAELKADQIRAAGPDPRMVDRGAGPLSVSLEPVPG